MIVPLKVDEQLKLPLSSAMTMFVHRMDQRSKNLTDVIFAGDSRRSI